MLYDTSQKAKNTKLYLETAAFILFLPRLECLCKGQGVFQGLLLSLLVLYSVHGTPSLDIQLGSRCVPVACSPPKDKPNYPNITGNGLMASSDFDFVMKFN